MKKMMTWAAKAARFLVPLALLDVAMGNAIAPHSAASARVVGGVARYTSAAYGYTLRVPTGWARIPGARWTPAGPRADLTLMTPDHQAALGVIVSPTGSRRYSDAEVGVDGFATATDPALGVRLEYPTQWTAVSVPNTNAGLQSADQTVLVTLQAQRTDAETLGPSDLQSVANAQIAQVSNGLPPSSYQTMRINGVLYLRAFIPSTITRVGNGMIGQVSVTVASYRHRLYSLRAIALNSTGGSVGFSAPDVYPYFSPFTTLARLTHNTGGLQSQEGNLAAQTTLSLFIDPHVPEA